MSLGRLLAIGGATKYWALSPKRVAEAVADLQDRAALLRLCTVAGRGVHDFVSEHRGQLTLEIAPGDQVVADSDAILVVAAADWPAVESGARAIREKEDDLRAGLGQGRHLADLLKLPA